jgi:ADP-ribose pyrophosphatase
MSKPIVPREIQKVFQGRIFAVQIETIALPKGGEMKAEIVRHPGSVVIVPVTDAGEIILVRQYRPAIGRWAWELPAGTLKDGEDPQRAARRECHEEIGLVPTGLERLRSFFPTPGYCDEEMNFYRATGLRRPGADDEAAQPDEDEDIEPKAFSMETLKAMIESGEIIDLKTVAGVSLLEMTATPTDHGGRETRRTI